MQGSNIEGKSPHSILEGVTCMTCMNLDQKSSQPRVQDSNLRKVSDIVFANEQR